MRRLSEVQIGEAIGYWESMASQSVSGPPQGSSGDSRLGKKNERPRRIWSQAEEEVLIASVKELIAQGWKSDNGFRAGYLGRLEEAMKKHFPGTDLKQNPHINSKLSGWKKSYYALSIVLGKSGVGFNSGTLMIECEDDAWEQVLKLDSNAKLMRYKSWPYYYAWLEIFGKDRANGEGAEDLLDAYNAVRDEDVSSYGGSGGNYEFHPEDVQEKEAEADSISHSQKSAPIPMPKGKKRKACDEMQAVCQIISEIGNKTDARLANLSLRVGYEFDLGKSKNEAFNQLGFIDWMTLEQRFDVCEILSKDVSKLEVFRGLPAEAIPHYVERLLNNKGQ